MSNVNSPIPLCNVAIKPSAIREGIRTIDLNSHENIDLKTVLKSHESIREVEGKEAWNSCWRSEGVDVQRLKTPGSKKKLTYMFYGPLVRK